MKNKKACIVGAGSAGLPAARWALAYGITPVVFEKSKHIGGLWRYDENGCSVLKSSVLNTSKEMSAYSDFPPPDDFPNFIPHDVFIRYLEMYADKHQLFQFIRFEHTVMNISRAEDYEEPGKWIVEYREPGGRTESEEFDCVLLANGLQHMEPHCIIRPYIDQFQGHIYHSSDFNHVPKEILDGKTNAIVGSGNSAVDIAVELSRMSAKTYLSTRGNGHFVARVWDFGQPYDFRHTRLGTWIRNVIPKRFYDRWVEYFARRRFDFKNFGLLASRISRVHHTSNDELPFCLICGKIVVKPAVKEFTKNGIKWIDDTITESIDNVILGTGYRFNFKMVEHGSLIPIEADTNYTPLYKFIWPISLTDHKTLGVIGLIRPNGAIINTCEMQARAFLHVLFKKWNDETEILPDNRKMEHEIREFRKQMCRDYGITDLQRFIVDYVSYNDDLASLIGCKPSPISYLISDLNLAYKLLFGPNVAYNYRLTGPHPWDGARDAIVEVVQRMKYPFNRVSRENGQKSNIVYLFVGILLFMVFMRFLS